MLYQIWISGYPRFAYLIIIQMWDGPRCVSVLSFVVIRFYCSRITFGFNRLQRDKENYFAIMQSKNENWLVFGLNLTKLTMYKWRVDIISKFVRTSSNLCAINSNSKSESHQTRVWVPCGFVSVSSSLCETECHVDLSQAHQASL